MGWKQRLPCSSTFWFYRSDKHTKITCGYRIHDGVVTIPLFLALQGAIQHMFQPGVYPNAGPSLLSSHASLKLTLSSPKGWVDFTQPGFELSISRVASRRADHYATRLDKYSVRLFLSFKACVHCTKNWRSVKGTWLSQSSVGQAKDCLLSKIFCILKFRVEHILILSKKEYFFSYLIGSLNENPTTKGLKRSDIVKYCGIFP